MSYCCRRSSANSAAGKQVAFRLAMQTGLAKPVQIYEALEERGADYAIRIPAQ